MKLYVPFNIQGTFIRDRPFITIKFFIQAADTTGTM